MNSTERSNENMSNLLMALEALADIEQPEIPFSKLIYSEDGAIIGITEDKVTQGLWQPVDRQAFESKHGGAPYPYLRFIDGKIIDIRPSAVIDIAKDLVPGDAWYADKTFRLIVGDRDEGTDGWKKRDR